MRVQINPSNVKLWLSARDTEAWANKAGARWPCSELSGHRLFAEFDSNGLLDIAIDGNSSRDCSGTEFNAITSDFLYDRLPITHPAWFVTVGQFRSRD